MKRLSNADILSKKPFRLSDNDRKTIIDEIKRRDAMEYVVGDCDINGNRRYISMSYNEYYDVCINTSININLSISRF